MIFKKKRWFWLAWATIRYHRLRSLNNRNYLCVCVCVCVHLYLYIYIYIDRYIDIDI